MNLRSSGNGITKQIMFSHSVVCAEFHSGRWSVLLVFFCLYASRVEGWSERGSLCPEVFDRVVRAVMSLDWAHGKTLSSS